ncbi:VC0807 family protein [Gottfriedia acidiceleris]|uniref:VC0807 family protein n=1 Tax=Gottfriedia acidiceleris TaxID=371036 RepID=UPI000B42D982|nr:VC0807 family protein [Gottfriedia acidiceleris]
MSKRMYIIFTLVINGILPWVIYVVLSDYMSSILALSIATLIPLVDNVVHLWKHKRLDAFGGLMLFTLILTLLLVFLGGSEKILLVRESLITASVGIIFLVSLFFKRPIMFYLGMRFIQNNRFAENWNIKYFRFVMRLMTFVWGIMLLAEAIVRIIMVYNLSTERYLLFSNYVLYGFIGAAILWTIIYRRKSASRLQEIKSQLTK